MALNIEECQNKKYVRLQTNPRYNTFTQSIFTAGDIDQFNTVRKKGNLKAREESEEPEVDKLHSAAQALIKLNFWEKFNNTDSRAVINTFSYLFYKFKKGIFIRIINNKIETFLPFSNAHYKNEFSDRIKVDPKYNSIQGFLNDVAELSGYNNQKHIPLSEWYSNNGLFRFEYQKNEGDNNVIILKDMFETLCKTRQIPDIEFFINRRDFPLLKRDSTEPYNNIFDSNTEPLISHNYEKYIPILSGSTNKKFADIAFPLYEDWARVVYQKTGKVFLPSCREYPIIKQTDWHKKESKAVFRGSSTGVGINNITNQRINAFEKGLKSDVLDIGITSWNLRVRKISGYPYLQTIKRKTYPIANKLSLQEQSEKFKYILNLEGHVAAYRLSYELSSGSVILLADTKWDIWYKHLLKPFKHYVPVDYDLKNLETQILWCKKHDEECRLIAKHALNFYNNILSETGMLSYLQKLLWSISKFCGVYEYTPDLLAMSLKTEKTYLNSIKFTDLNFKYDLPRGPRCVGRLDGFLPVFRSKSINNLKFIKNIITTRNSQINLYQVNDFCLISKQPNNYSKELENIHESFIGLKCTNTLISKIPNFAYIFGPLKNSPNLIFVEYIPRSIPFSEWLRYSFNFADYINILIQINLAIQVAQNFVGFIHYDLYPWNIMIQTLEKQVSFNYPISAKKCITINTHIIAMIIDYGKSRGVIYNKESNSLNDHGFVNLFKPNSIIDTLTLLYSSLNILQTHNNRSAAQTLQIYDFHKLLAFPKELNIPNYTDVSRYNKYSSLFKISTTGKKPIDFIDHLYYSFPNIVKLQKTTNFFYQTEQGNALLQTSYLLTNNDNISFLTLLTHIDKSTPPLSSNIFFQHIIKLLLVRRMNWIDNEIEYKANDTIKKKWLKMKKNFIQPPAVSQFPILNFPKPKSIYIDEDITPIEVNRFAKYATFISNNWCSIWVLSLEAFLFGVPGTDNPNFQEFININGFDYLNAICSHNTILKIQHYISASAERNRPTSSGPGISEASFETDAVLLETNITDKQHHDLSEHNQPESFGIKVNKKNT